MRKAWVLLFTLIFCSAALLYGCGPQKAATTGEAIQASKAMQTVDQKVNYLIDQAKAFYNSKDYQGAIDIAQYVLSAIDQDSAQAKSIIERAKDALSKMAKEQAEKLKGAVGSMGK